MTTTFYIFAALGWLVSCVIAYALGWYDGYENATKCRRCDNARN